MRLGRRAWGCDLNPEVIKWRPTLTDYDSQPKIAQPKYDKEYPFYKFEEAGLTIEQIHKISAHLLETLSPEEIAKAPGIGIMKARKMKEALQGTSDEKGTVQKGLDSF